MIYRLRFENTDQLFDIRNSMNDIFVILPLKEIVRHLDDELIQSLSTSGKLIAEIPSVLWENSIEKCRKDLNTIKSAGVADAVCENISAVNICSELDIGIHCGMYLNIINSVSAESYRKLGALSLTLSFEMPFSKMRSFSSAIPYGAVIYGYLPLMKFRNCPAQRKNGCAGCTKDNYLTDRKNEHFCILCRDSQYSELLNCVPLYAADKSVPKLDFYTLYFTVEAKDECEKIFDMVRNEQTPDFRRTAGLYGRQLQ